MFQTEHDRFHRHAPLEESAGGVEQDQASQQPQHQMPVVGVFPLDLARLRRQQMLQRAEVVFNPAPPLPGPDQTGRRDGAWPDRAGRSTALPGSCTMTTVTDPYVGLVAVSRAYRIPGSWRLSRQGQSTSGQPAPDPSPGARRAAGRRRCVCPPRPPSRAGGAPRAPATSSRQTSDRRRSGAPAAPAPAAATRSRSAPASPAATSACRGRAAQTPPGLGAAP